MKAIYGALMVLLLSASAVHALAKDSYPRKTDTTRLSIQKPSCPMGSWAVPQYDLSFRLIGYACEKMNDN